MMALWIRELNISYNKKHFQEWMMGRDRRYIYRKDVLLVAFIIKMNILFKSCGADRKSQF